VRACVRACVREILALIKNERIGTHLNAWVCLYLSRSLFGLGDHMGLWDTCCGTTMLVEE